MALEPRVVQFSAPVNIRGMGSLMQAHRAQCNITVDRKLRCVWVSSKVDSERTSHEVPFEAVKCIEWVEVDE